MRSTVIRAFLIFVFLARPFRCKAAEESRGDFFVAPGGDDGNPGSIDRPFRSIERARDAVRGRIAGGLKSDVLVFLREGRYELSAPVRFGPEDSGTAERSITYAAFAGETPVVSGGRRLAGWKRGEGGLWTVEVPGALPSPSRPSPSSTATWLPRSLFIDGRRTQRARTPNEGFFRIDGDSSQDKPFRLKFHGGDIHRAWADAGDVEIVAMLAWAELRSPIRSVDEAGRVAVLGVDPRPSNREANARYYVENAPGGLDAPGEWRLDPKTGTIAYLPRPGEDPERFEAVAPVLKELVILDGDAAAGKPIRNLHFRGITFAFTEWTQPRDGYADSQAAVAVGGAFKAQGALGCAVEACTFAHLGSYAVEFARGCQRNRIARCEMGDLAAGGVRIGETAQRPDERDRAEGNVVSDNRIHDGGLVHHAAVGIWIGQSSGNEIVHNEVRDFFYTAISVGWTWGYGPNQCKGNRIESNHLHRIGKDMLSDMGGIYTLGVQPGTTIRRNLIHDVSAFTYGGWGIYPDEGSSEILIEENIVFRCKSALFHQHYGRENIVRNNIFALGREHQLMRTRMEGHRSFVFEGNILYWSEGALLGSNWTDAQYSLDRNIYWRTGGGEIRLGNWSWDEWRARGQDRQSRIADPLFADPEKGDFRLKPGSPALEMGFRPIDAAGIGPRS